MSVKSNPEAAERLRALRAELHSQALDGFVLPCTDAHLGEYCAPCDQRVAWLTGFTGSAGVVVVLADQAIVFSDGRYTLQLVAEVPCPPWQLGHMIQTPPPTWLAATAPGARIGYDPWLLSEEGLARYTAAGLEMVAMVVNPVDALWVDRPAAPAAPARPYRQSGQEAADKRAGIAASLRAEGIDAAVISDPASVNWLLNLRGGDVAFSPIAQGFCLIEADGSAQLFMAAAKLDGPSRAWLGNQVAVQPVAHLAQALAAFAGRRVRLDPAASPVWFGQTLRAGGATLVPGSDPCLLPKASKNATEQDGARAAHRRDAVALCRFLHAMARAAPGQYTELSAAALLDRFRAVDPAYRGESFPAISGAGPNGAIIHYRVSPETNRPIGADELYLIDSGGQYPDGTTDVTRTVWMGPGAPPAVVRDRYTRVLAGHIDIARLVFPVGIAGPHVDALARVALWQAGLDYDHGTGHGVGSYLSVHEGPAGIARTARMIPLAAGMILSDEPGFYAPGDYGIRLENLLLVQPAGFEAPFLRFEPLTLAPFARGLIAPALLSEVQRAWLDEYHAIVMEQIGPLLPAADATWLAAATAPLGPSIATVQRSITAAKAT